MSDAKQIIFVSCGQVTVAEKDLGKQIAKIVESFGFQRFFAETVQDLNGLEANILRALRDCSAFITVLHPRGTFTRLDGSTFVRASVWTEQEIAVAAYIKYVENREIPVIAFTHESVTREGIRDQLHMNPISFRSEEEVLAKLPARLRDLVVPAPPTIALRFESVPVPRQAEHTIRQLQITVFNGTNVRISTYNGKVWIPKPLLIHWDGTQYSFEDKKAATETHRCFQFSEQGRGAINPQDSMPPFVIEYCTQCAVDARNLPQSVSEMEFEASAWVNGRKYSLKRSLIQLSQDATR